MNIFRLLTQLSDRVWSIMFGGSCQFLHHRPWLAEVRCRAPKFQSGLARRSVLRGAHDCLEVFLCRKERGFACNRAMVSILKPPGVPITYQHSVKRVYLAVAGLGVVLNILF